MLETILSGPFWLALGEIIGVNILLSGDNAVVIALACRSLPERERTLAVIGGSAGAIAMRIGFSAIVVWLLTVPYLQLVGGALLLWIGVRLMLPEAAPAEDGRGPTRLWSAVWTIIVADVVMSLDNVVAIVAIAADSLALILIGLLASVPFIVFGSTLMLRVLDRFPVLVTAGAGLLGWIAGDIIGGAPELAAPGFVAWSGVAPAWVQWLAKPVCAVLVMAIGGTLSKWLARDGAVPSKSDQSA